ncbi:hypothetical protein Dimus_031032 [Dionaea muscipula]
MGPRRRPPLTLLSTLFSIISLLTIAGSTSPDAAAMAALKSSLILPSSIDWSDPDPCNWQHVRCDTGNRITRIQLGNSGVSGSLSPSISNLASLVVLELMNNNFTGALPSLRGLSNLESVVLHGNGFSSIPSDFFNGLSSLQVAYLDSNPFQPWSIPQGLQSASSLQNFSANSANVVGVIPDFFNSTTFPGLAHLHLVNNGLEGVLPAGFAGLSLQSLWLTGQKSAIGTRTLNGSIGVVGNMTRLEQVWLGMNGFTGPIPDLSGLSGLWNLNLRDNGLTGFVPSSLTNLNSLRVVNLTNNGLQGPTPKFSESVAVDMIKGTNSFCLTDPGVDCDPRVDSLIAFLQPFGYPSWFSQNWRGNDPCNGWPGITCTNGNITMITLQGKGLSGTISPIIATLTSVEVLVLSHNDITGSIPMELTLMPKLKKLDLSVNHLYGNIPDFPNTAEVITTGNEDIGKDHHPSPRSPDSPPPPHGEGDNNDRKKNGMIMGIIAAVILVVGISTVWLIRTRRRKRKPKINKLVYIHPSYSGGSSDDIKISMHNSGSGGSDIVCSKGSSSNMSSLNGGRNMFISIEELRSVTDNFSEEKILGRGGSGIVYKGEYPDGRKVAVKAIGMAPKGQQEFESEIGVLTKVRHKNLVALLGYSRDESALLLLVYQYMPQGSLQRHLIHWEEEGLNPLSWKQRLSIALDVARGVEYLHNTSDHIFIHRDLKPSNILLADDMQARVSDFGLVRHTLAGSDPISTKIAGTYGYLAPEYAATGRITTKVDVYSFGVILMELITGHKALDLNKPGDDKLLSVEFVRLFMENNLSRIVDPVINLNEETLASIREVATLACHCCIHEEELRPDMSRVLTVLAPIADRWKPTTEDVVNSAMRYCKSPSDDFDAAPWTKLCEPDYKSSYGESFAPPGDQR